MGMKLEMGIGRRSQRVRWPDSGEEIRGLWRSGSERMEPTQLFAG